MYKNDLKRLRHPFQTFTLHTQVIWPLALSTNLKAYQRRPFHRVPHTPFYLDHTTPLLFSFKAIWNTKGQPCTRPYFESTVKKSHLSLSRHFWGLWTDTLLIRPMESLYFWDFLRLFLSFWNQKFLTGKCDHNKETQGKHSWKEAKSVRNAFAQNLFKMRYNP